MKKFKFNLQRILTIKEKKEDLLKQELQRLIYKQNQYVKVKEYYEEMLAETYADMRNKGSFTSEEHMLQEQYVFSIRNNIYSQDLMIKDYGLKIEAKRAELFENRKEVKTLEKLKEKEREEYLYIQMQEERKVMDEIAAQRVIRESINV